MTGLTYYCYGCYGENAAPHGRCRSCGGPIEVPMGTSFPDLLVWALLHPVAEIATHAAALLGTLRERTARARLRDLAEDADPYLAAQALRSLVQIDGVAELRPLLERLRADGSAPVRRVAAEALGE